VLPDASLLILKAWAVIGVALIGLGLLFRRLSRAPAASVEDVIESFWLGWALLLLLLQLWHFFLPVDQRAAIAAVVIGVIGVVAGGWRPWWAVVRGLPRHLPTVACFVLLALGVSNRALDGPHFGDVGLYHLPVVYWNEAYPIVPGLGNLFVPFGHNISYFLWVAVLEVGPFAHRSFHLANSVLMLALLARGLLGLDRLTRVWRSCTPADVFWALVLPVAVAQAFSLFFTSPSPDQPILAFELVLAGALLTFIGRAAPRRADFDVLAITLLATAAVTVKLSTAGLAGATFLLVLVRWLWRERPLRQGDWSTVVAAAEIGVAGATIWITGNIVLSGCPLYPSDLAALPVDWRVRADAVKWIEAPMTWGAPLWQVIRDWRWVLQRLNSWGWYDPNVLLPLSIALVATLAACLHRLIGSIRRRPSGRRVPLIILVPALVSLAFCFVYAPMPRYAGATPWILAADSVLVFIGGAAYGKGPWVRAIIALAVVTAIGGVLLAQRPLLLPVRDFQIKPAPQVEKERLPTGLEVWVPRHSNTCWDAPLPCTPEPQPGLRLRRPGDLAAGFAIDPSVLPATGDRKR
jgi:hypothetical protein